jgi:hypothetical protein
VFANPFSASTHVAFDASGTYALQLTASDGLLAGSDIVLVRVVHAPTARITAPAARALFSPGEPVAVAADATDADGQVVRVDFYQDGQLAEIRGRGRPSPAGFTR